MCHFQEFDRNVKSFVYILDGAVATTKMQLPKDSKQSRKSFSKAILFFTKLCYEYYFLITSINSLFLFHLIHGYIINPHLLCKEPKLDEIFQDIMDAQGLRMWDTIYSHSPYIQKSLVTCQG